MTPKTLLEEMQALPDDYDEKQEEAEEQHRLEEYAKRFFGGY